VILDVTTCFILN